MSIKVSITDPGGRMYEIEAPVNAVAATDSKTPYAETQQMLTDYTARVVSAVLGQYRDPACFPYDSNIHWSRQRMIGSGSSSSPETFDQRTLDACYVERVGSGAVIAEDEIRVVVKPASRSTARRSHKYQYKLKKFAPLRRVLNAYTAEIGRDKAHFELSYNGDRIYYDDTAEELSISNGDTLKAHYHPPHDSMSPLLEAVKAEAEEL